ncbi:uncharacterized protein LOC110826197 [Carica papaya]|uniref:uncharacterized protein LOC110826197 n=1 Tax=Carica papaya TaxID=3649 RepID=UPI000B8C7F0C|nr:uncharacterized protein LOC110826197 [Carica papaya]
MDLPRYIVIKSPKNNKYLRYIHEDVQVHSLLQFTGEEAVNPYVKFEVEPAKTVKGLVHIKCCYNNKYWVRWTDKNYWIVCAADQPEEDVSKWNCTLFKPTIIGGNLENVRLLHVQLNQYCALWFTNTYHNRCLFAGAKEPDQYSVTKLAVFDWESFLIFPKHVAFKGDNDLLLSARWINGKPHNEFAIDDVGNPSVGYEIFTTNDGSIRIKSDYFGKFLARRGSNWVLGDAADDDKSKDTLFWPVKVDTNVVALKNLGNNYFCKRFTAERMTSCLNATVPTIAREARLEVVELVVSRQIFNVNFRLLDARIYDEKPISMTRESVVNRSSQPNEAEVKLSYTESTSSTWNASVSLKLGVQTTFKTGIPFIMEGEIQISAEFEGSYQWGNTREESKEIETVYKVTVPPHTKMTISVLATKGTCDVPFSYTQRDTLMNGMHVTRYLHDGIYTGINCFNFKHETTEEKL